MMMMLMTLCRAEERSSKQAADIHDRDAWRRSGRSGFVGGGSH